MGHGPKRIQELLSKVNIALKRNKQPLNIMPKVPWWLKCTDNRVSDGERILAFKSVKALFVDKPRGCDDLSFFFIQF